MTYPNDVNGDALRRMESQGDDLTKPRNIDFTTVFADASSAERFAEHFRTLGYDAALERNDNDPNFPWDVVVVKRMVPSHDEISAFESQLQSVAEGWGGHIDGWGCFSEQPSASS